MYNTTKVPFSLAEIQLIENAEVFLTKKKAFDNVMLYLSKMQRELTNRMIEDDQLKWITDIYTHQKISTGENYQLMPYQISDFPALFAKEDVFTMRCLVWWGNEVSIHFLLRGKYYNQYIENVESNLNDLPPGFFRCITASPWEHEFIPSNYQLLQAFPFNSDETTFVKIGKKYALDILTKGTTEIVNDILLLLKLIIKT